jgi:hypothetical protein
VNLLQALAKVEELDPETFLHLNKQAKDLGLKQTPSISLLDP